MSVLRKAEPLTCEGYVLEEPAFGYMGAPAAVVGHPELISFWFMGHRRVLDREFYGYVYSMVNQG